MLIWSSFFSFSTTMANVNLHKVFVYGTLKKGEPNHQWFSKDTSGYFKLICNAKTVEKYPLIIGTKYNIPFLLYKPGSGNNVQGELYEVNDTVFANLDILEDHPSFYVREEREVQAIGTDNKIRTWIYFIKNFKPELLQQKFYENYSNNGPHGLQYVSRYLRDECFDHKLEVQSKTNE